MFQRWHDLLFMHWPVPAAALRPLIPPALTLDTFGGAAWIGIVPFRMSGVRARGLPPLPGLSAFPELNVRTYVTLDGKPGVWFFSLDATNPPAIVGARLSFRLPYFPALMSCGEKSGEIAYRSRRLWRPGAALAARYHPTGDIFNARPGSLDHWLTERYCLYSAGGRRLYRSDIRHQPWPLQPAACQIQKNTMTDFLSLQLPAQEPLLHFARRQDVWVERLRRVR
jgi:uncharacterized protein YqjF (DUF2071 family)